RSERVAGFHLLNPRDGFFDEAIVDALLDENARRAGADFTLIEREQAQAFQRFIKELVVLIHYVGEEDVRALAAELYRGGNEGVGRVAQDLLTHWGGAGEGDLCDAFAGGQCIAGLLAVAVHNVDHARRQQIADDFHEQQNGGRRLFGRLHDHWAAGRECGGQLPGRHEYRKIPGDDLAHHA